MLCPSESSAYYEPCYNSKAHGRPARLLGGVFRQRLVRGESHQQPSHRAAAGEDGPGAVYRDAGQPKSTEKRARSAQIVAQTGARAGAPAEGGGTILRRDHPADSVSQAANDRWPQSLAGRVSGPAGDAKARLRAAHFVVRGDAPRSAGEAIGRKPDGLLLH